MTRSSDLVGWLRAAGEPSRLRLLALCADRELSVSDLGKAVGQSGPRVSRHLKILCDAGLLQRVRRGQWVHYRLPEGGEPAQFLSELLAQLDRAETVLARDRQRASIAEAHTGRVVREPAAGSRLGRALKALIESSIRPEGSALLIGVRFRELLEVASAPGRSCLAVAPTRRAARAAEEHAAEHGLACQMHVGAGLDVLRGERERDAVILDCVAMPGERLAGALAAARAALSAEGTLWVLTAYDELAQRPREGTDGPHPLARLRALLAAAGLKCLKLSPIEADGEHLLVAEARAIEAQVGTDFVAALGAS
jgi:ArsR family transcriptional regulator